MLTKSNILNTKEYTAAVNTITTRSACSVSLSSESLLLIFIISPRFSNKCWMKIFFLNKRSSVGFVVHKLKHASSQFIR